MKDVINNDLYHYAVFITKYCQDLNDLRYELMNSHLDALRDRLFFSWPVIQGTSNQLKIQEISEQEFDIDKAFNALRALSRISENGWNYANTIPMPKNGQRVNLWPAKVTATWFDEESEVGFFDDDGNKINDDLIEFWKPFPSGPHE